MKCFALLMLSAFPALGQLTLQQIQPFFNGSGAAAVVGTPPNQIVNARFWWHWSDAGATNANVVSWTDRIGGLILTNQATTKQPTNSALGVGFNGSTYLTNTSPFQILVGTGRTGSVWVVCSLVTSAGALGGVTCDNTSGGGGLFESSGNQFKWFGAGGSGTVCDFVSGANIRDFALLITNTVSGQMLFYTNNVFINTPGIGAGDTTNPQRWVGCSETGSDTAVNFAKMKLLDLAYFYGKLTAADLTGLHTWATNQYSGFGTFSP